MDIEALRLVVAAAVRDALADSDKLLTEDEAAAYLRLTSVATLQDWRYRKVGPVPLRAGRRLVRYRKRDLDAWLVESAAAAACCRSSPMS